MLAQSSLDDTETDFWSGIMEEIEQPVQTWIATQSPTELDYIVKGASRTGRRRGRP